MRGSTDDGFTLIELMVTIAIVAILLAIALPSFESSIRSNTVATTTNELMGSLALARSEAIRNPGGAVICTSLDGATCGGTWNDGWIVGPDLDADGTLGVGDRVVRYVEPRERLTLAATSSGGSATAIVFDRRGRVADGNRREVVMTPTTCPANAILMRSFVVRVTGQVTVTKGSCT